MDNKVLIDPKPTIPFAGHKKAPRENIVAGRVCVQNHLISFHRDGPGREIHEKQYLPSAPVFALVEGNIGEH